MTNTEEEPPPKTTDLDGWRRAIADGSYRAFRMEAVVAAIQDLGPNADEAVINSLALHATDRMTGILRNRIGVHHRNEGEDLIDEARDRLIQAMLNPKSADGKGLRVAFYSRVSFRAADVIRKAEKANERESDVEDIDTVADPKYSSSSGPRKDMDENAYVEEILRRVTDLRKRLAFRLHIEGVPCKSSRSESISKVLDVSDKTAEKWVKEVQAQLKLIVGEKS